MKKKISIVTPTYNEEENIEKLCSSIAIEMALYDYEYEHIIIDNHSTDKTVEKIKKIAFSDKKVKLIVNSRNFGSIRSTHHAILQTDSDATILMCADMQEPINLIGKYLKEWEMGSKVVLGQRESVEDLLPCHSVPFLRCTWCVCLIIPFFLMFGYFSIGSEKES